MQTTGMNYAFCILFSFLAFKLVLAKAFIFVARSSLVHVFILSFKNTNAYKLFVAVV